MSKPRYIWWDFARNMAKAYPDLYTRFRDQKPYPEDIPVMELPPDLVREYEAVRRALKAARRLSDGAGRLDMVRLVFWERCTEIVKYSFSEFCPKDTSSLLGEEGLFATVVAVLWDCGKVARCGG